MRNASPLTLRHPRSHFQPETVLGWTFLAIILSVAPPGARAATVWSGSKITFTKLANSDPNLAANQDRITPNVWITRGATQGIYNAKTETLYAHNFSPADTEWAYGTTANYATLTYKSWEAWYGGSLGGGPPTTVGLDAVVHLKTEDIYIDIKFLSWGVGLAGAGAFSYERSTAGAPQNTAPTVSIDTPTNGASFTVPANVTVTALASDSDGSVTNVQFFDGTSALGGTNESPYSIVANLAAGSHGLTAVATDSLGLSSTSSVVNVTVSADNLPPVVAITGPTNGTVLALPVNLSITADASDPGGSVAGVQFFDGTNSLGSDSSSPYSINVDLYPGVHPLTAVATDNLGLAVTSTAVSVTVTSTPIANPIADRIPKGDITVELRTIADGMISPLGMAVPDDGSGRIFVYDQAGLVWLVTASGRSPKPVLDLRTRMVNISGSYDERGLLGLALHTNFAQFPYLYTYTSEFNSGPADFPSNLQLGGTNNHQSVIAEWRLNPSTTNVVDPATRREIVRIDKPQSNHNGGTMRFGPDGLLYVSLGDGGNADDQGDGHTDPGGNGQNINEILGSVIRIDVDGSNSANGKYGVPSDNPFVGLPGVDEVYAYGLQKKRIV